MLVQFKLISLFGSTSEEMATPDKLLFRCPRCDKAGSVAVQYASKRGKCPGCAALVKIPALPQLSTPPLEKQSGHELPTPSVASSIFDQPLSHLPIPKEDDVFACRIPDGKVSVCRIIGKRRTSSKDEWLVGITKCVRDGIPDLGDPLINQILVLDHHSWMKEPALVWVSGTIPENFRHLGVLKHGREWTVVGNVGSGGWGFITSQASEQFKWDQDQSLEAQQQRIKKAVEVDEKRKQELMKQQMEARAFMKHLANAHRRCPKCGKEMSFGSNSSWPAGGVWWCETVNPPYGCGYEITPSTHPDEFPGYFDHMGESQY